MRVTSAMTGNSPLGGFPVIAETTRNHTFSKEISQVILAAMVLAPNFCCKNCQRVIPAMRGNPPLKSVLWTLADVRHDRIMQSPREIYFNLCRQHSEIS